MGQECERMNSLLSDIFVSLEELELGLSGALNMTDAMDALANALKVNRVPPKWGVYYFSKKPLNAWYSDMADRCNQLVEWTKECFVPKSVCLSYLFNPMSFLTAIQQNTAREKGLPLDDMTLQTNVTVYKEPTDITAYPPSGAYIHGFFLEGAAWELGGVGAEGYLIDQKLKELHP